MDCRVKPGNGSFIGDKPTLRQKFLEQQAPLS
jgi:hypothetical protein